MSPDNRNSEPGKEPRQGEAQTEAFVSRSVPQRRENDETLVPRSSSETKHIDPFQTILPAVPVTSNAQIKPGLGLMGDYELLEELGRGGMGVVYRARQRSIDRIVALKVIRHDQLQSHHPESQRSAVDRFHQESIAAAKLEHDHIIRLYEVGESDGQQYFSMQYVRGPSLSEVVRNGPLASGRAATYMAAVATAVAAAHEAGILHRDLKPQNVMLDEAADRALVADFGLAKLIGGEDQLTMAGEIMGTPSYMPPEQARDASRVTAKSDVYSLGATLYHLLTARPPFQAATVVETIRQVMDDPPLPPRRLNPAIDRDIETICLKCLEKEPTRRYATAKALADDLSRYVRGEPIAARPLSVWGRTVRLCRRNPVTAAWIGTAATFFLVALIASFVGYVTTSRALAASEARYRQSRSTVDFFFTRVSETGLLDQPGMQGLREDLLSRALAHYHEFVESRRHDPGLENELGQASFRLARITEMIRSPAEAIDLYRRSLAVQRRLMRENADNETFRSDAAETLNAMGRAFYKLKQLEEAERALREARILREELVASDAADAERMRRLANTVMNLGLVEQERGNDAAAKSLIAEAQRRRSQLLDRDADDVEVRRDRAMGYYNVGTRVRDIDEPTLAEAAEGVHALENAIEDFQAILKRRPGSLADQSRLVLCRRILGDVCLGLSDVDAALDCYLKARVETQRLAEQNPLVLEYQKQLAGLDVSLADLQLSRQDFDAAVTSLESAVTTLAPLADKAPDFRRDLAVAYYQLAFALLHQRQLELAVPNLMASISNFKMLHEQWPENDEYSDDLRRSENSLRDVRALLRSAE